MIAQFVSIIMEILFFLFLIASLPDAFAARHSSYCKRSPSLAYVSRYCRLWRR